MKSFIFCCLALSLNAELYTMDIPATIANSAAHRPASGVLGSETYNILPYTANAKVQDKSFADIVGKYIEFRYESPPLKNALFPLFKNIWACNGINTNFNLPLGASLLFPGPSVSCSTLEVAPYYAYDFDTQRICAQSIWYDFVVGPWYFSINGIRSYSNETSGPRAINSPQVSFSATDGNGVTTTTVTTSKTVTTNKNEAGNVTGTTESVTTQSKTVLGDGKAAAIGMFQVFTPTSTGKYTLGIGFVTTAGRLIEGSFTLTVY